MSSFHLDEVLAVTLLLSLSKFKDGSVLRTRDEEKLGKCDVLVDVGGVYDPENNRFDHHQREFNEKFPMKCSNGEEPCTKMSSAGLVYKHFGRQILRERYGEMRDGSSLFLN